ncbi:MAG: DUF6483 family protein [Tissierellales bacterium]
MLQQDFVMKQIKSLINFLARVLLKKESVDYVLNNEEKYAKVDSIHNKLMELIELGKINEAENLLFDELDTSDLKYLELALDFYNRLNKLDDDFLDKNDFSREEIEEGLREIAREFGIII